MSAPTSALTAALRDADRAFLWHPFTPMKPWCENKDIVIIERGEREYLIDTDGRRYLDAVSSLWCNIHGHCVPEIDAAVREQLGKIAHTTLLGAANVPSIQLAQRLIELVQSCGLQLAKVFYSDNGSTAVEVACKMAYQYWLNRDTHGRTKFLALQNAYHGDTLGAVSVGGIPTFHSVYKSLCFPVDFLAAPVRPPFVTLPTTRTTELQVPAEESRRLAAFTQSLEAHLAAHAQSYAAIIIEPLIQGAGGMLMHVPGTLRAIRQLADRFNLLLIADEVMTGFGRTGKMFACQHESVTPDFLCLSKGLTAGYMPLGATLTTQNIFDAFYDDPRAGKTFFHGHTFTGHPLACAAALASLDLFDQNNLLHHVAKIAPLVDDILAPLHSHPHVADVRRLGLVAAVDLVQDKSTTPQPFPAHWRIGGALSTRLRSLGILTRPLADTLVLMPPLAISPENLQHICHSMVQSLAWLPEVIAEKQKEFGT